MTFYDYLILGTSVEEQTLHVKWRCEACDGEFPNVINAVVTGSLYCEIVDDVSSITLDSLINKTEIEQDLQLRIEAQAAEIAALKGQA